MLRTLVAAAVAVYGAAAATPSFEVASVRVSQLGRTMREGSRREDVHVSPDGVTMRNMRLRSCIAWANHVLDFQVSGPDWLASERYDVVAKAAGTTAEDDLRTMMQGLLADRFKVESHKVRKEMSAYVLVVAKGGLKVHESQGEGEPSIQPDRSRMTVTVQRGRVSQLVDMLSNAFHAPVIDETGLKGSYDFNVNIARYMPQAGDAPPDPLSLIQTALQEELGLKLESRKTVVDLVIVDHAEKTPTEN